MNRRSRLVVVTLSTLLMAVLLAGAVISKNSNPEDPYSHLAVFTEVLHRIKSDYVEEPDMKSVTLGAINGLLVSVDPFASYLSADQLKTYQTDRNKKKPNIGVVLSRKYGAELSVVDSIPGSPADEAGLTTGDIVEKINGISTRDMPLAYADLLLEGTAGTEVELTLLQLQKPDPTPVKIARRMVAIPKLSSKMLPGDIGYIHVFDTEPGRTADVARAVKALTKQGAQKLVLDLRRAVEGDPDEGIALANLFIEKGELGYLEGQKYDRKNFRATPSNSIYSGPLVVLVNRSTCNGAEVAAAALGDSKRAELVGEKTYGWAALQKTLPTEDGGAVILAVAKFYSPDGKAIQNDGVTPTVPVMGTAAAASEEEEGTGIIGVPGQEAAPEGKETKQPGDAILEKAIDVLNGVNTQTARRTDGEPDWINSFPSSWSAKAPAKPIAQ